MDTPESFGSDLYVICAETAFQVCFHNVYTHLYICMHQSPGVDPGINVSEGALDRRGGGPQRVKGSSRWGALGPMIGKSRNSEKVYKVINNAGVR